MLKVTIQSWRGVSVLRCQGRIVVGAENSVLSAAVRSRADSETIVLDLTKVDRIDAGGLGVLLELRAWTRSNGIQLKLTNVRGRVQQVLELTRLKRVFEVCLVESPSTILAPTVAPFTYAPSPGAL